MIQDVDTYISNYHQTSWSRPYPPINRQGNVDEHDEPYFLYGNIDAKTLQEMKKFRLPSTFQPYKKREGFGIDCQKMAVSGFTNITKVTTMDCIKRFFGESSVEYICIATEIVENQIMPRMNIQIIIKAKKSIYTPFMDKVSGSNFEYHVTEFADAWNEYLKKGLQFIEYQLFSGSIDHGAIKHWSAFGKKQHPNQLSEELALKAFEIGKTDVNEAIIHLAQYAPVQRLSSLKRFGANLECYQKAVKVQTQYYSAHDKEFCWPDSFPDCTSNLKNAMNEWLVKHFRKNQRSKCLILIGDTGTGKTSFALSLPGIVNHCRGFWSQEDWNNNADYMVIDDIPWGKFKARGFPDPVDLITGQASSHVNGKYSKIREIRTGMSAIILMNPGPAAPLLELLDSSDENPEALFWRQRSFVYNMGPEEYFHKSTESASDHHNNIYNVDDLPLFQEARRQWHARKHRSDLINPQQDYSYNIPIPSSSISPRG